MKHLASLRRPHAGTTHWLNILFTILLVTCVAGSGHARDLSTSSDGDIRCESLNSPTAYATSSTCRAVVPGDFNEDGITDLATASNLAVSILLGHGAGGVGDGTYAAPANIPMTVGVLDITSSDFNNDGITDLAVCYPSQVKILLGNGTAGVGNGTFGTPVTFPAGTNTQKIAPGDFNEDGIADLVVTNGSSNNVSVLLGQGTNGVGAGTFAPAVSYATGNAPAQTVIGDFNEDGVPDLAVSNDSVTSNSVSVLLGQGIAGRGDGTFAAAVSYPTGGGNPFGLTTGDFNEDGRTDLAIVNVGSPTISILLGNGAGGVGNGTFAAPTTIASSTGGREIATADFDGDGRSDLVVTNVTNDKVQLFLGGGVGTIGNGTFALAASDSVGQDPRTFALGDFNEDGSPDLATAKSGGAVTAVLLGGCPTALDTGILAFDNSGQVWPVGSEQFVGWTRGAAVMAVNVELSRDGGANWETIASNVTESSFKWTVTPPATESARVRISDAAVTTRFDVSDVDFTICTPLAAGSPVPVGTDPTAGVSGDFNEDGIADLAITCRSLGVVQVLMGLGTQGVGNGSFAPPVSYAFDGEASDIIAADFNDDGITDLAFTNAIENSVEILVGEGIGGVGNGVFHIDPVCPPVAEGASALLAGDFNEDGVMDLAVACRISDIIAILIGIGGGGTGTGAFAPAVNLAVGIAASNMVAGDFDGDGIIDLLSISDGTSNTVLLTGQGVNGMGSGTFGIQVNPFDLPVAALGRAMLTGDFTGDGITDLVLTNPAMSSLLLLPGVCAGCNGWFGSALTVAVGTTPMTLQKGDFNVDGITDLAVAGPGGGPGGRLEVLSGGGSEGHGNGTFSRQATFPIGPGPKAILAGDFLEDNSTDLLVLCADDATLAPLLGGCQDAGGATITVTSPNGGETFPVGSEHVVSWTKTAGVGAVDIAVSRDGGANWEPILLNAAGSSFTWTVTPPLTLNALVRVSESALPNVTDASDGVFRISTPAGVDGPGDRDGGGATAQPVSSLSAAYPSPSSGEARFSFTLPRSVRATFEVYDASGRVVRMIADRTFASGVHAMAWDGRTADGVRSVDGVYFLRARWPGFDAVRKIVRVGTSG